MQCPWCGCPMMTTPDHWGNETWVCGNPDCPGPPRSAKKDQEDEE